MSNQLASSQTNDERPTSWPKRALALAGSGLGLGVVFDILFFGKMPGISFPIYIVLILGVLLVLARNLKVKLPKSALLLTLPLLFFAAMVAVRANEFLTFMNIAASLYLLAMVAYVTFKPQLPQFALGDYLAPVVKVPIDVIERAVATINEAAGVSRLMRKHEHLPQVLRGIAIALPLLVIFMALFASADLVFRKYVSDLFGFDLDTNLFFHVFWILAVGSACLGWLAYILRKPADVPATSGKVSKSILPKLSGIEMTIVAGALNLLFLGFIGVQIAYLFGGEQNIINQGFTYAQYARKGFFELIAVAVITFSLVLVAERMFTGEGKFRTYFKVLRALLIAQVMIIMVSAFQRLALYESAYGFTTLRVHSHIFIIWLAALLGLLLYRILRNKPIQMFAYGAFLSAIAVLAFVNVLNVDGFVANKNIARYKATGKIDPFYLRDLSADATPQLLQLLNAKDQRVRNEVASEFYIKEKLSHAESQQHWQSANLARSKAIDEIRAHKQQIDRIQQKNVPDQYYR